MKKHRDEFDIKLAAVMKKNMSNVSASDELIMKTLARVREEEAKQQAKVSPLKSSNGKAKRRLPVAMISGIAAAVIALVGVAVVFGVLRNKQSSVDQPGVTTPSVLSTGGVTSVVDEAIGDLPIPDHYDENETPVNLTIKGLTNRAYTIGAEVYNIFDLKNSYFSGLNDYYYHMANKSPYSVDENGDDKLPPRDDIEQDKKK